MIEAFIATLVAICALIYAGVVVYWFFGGTRGRHRGPNQWPW